MKKPCVVCGVRAARAFFCDPCQRSYDRQNEKDATISGMIAWAAARARKFELERTHHDNPLNLLDDYAIGNLPKMVHLSTPSLQGIAKNGSQPGPTSVVRAARLLVAFRRIAAIMPEAQLKSLLAEHDGPDTCIPGKKHVFPLVTTKTAPGTVCFCGDQKL